MKSYRVEAIVLKRFDHGEADRIVTLFSREAGKLTVLAKGVRKLTSKRVGSLEIGTRLSAQVIAGKGMDILSQTVILNSYPSLKTDLTSLTQLYQLLEIVDVLTREDQELPEVYDVLEQTLDKLTRTVVKKPVLLAAFKTITELLGFTPPEHFSELILKSYIEAISERQLKTKEYLSTKSE